MNIPDLPATVRIERGQDDGVATVAEGVVLPSGRVVVEWRPEAFPEGERTSRGPLSIYEGVGDAEQASGGLVMVDREGPA